MRSLCISFLIAAAIAFPGCALAQDVAITFGEDSSAASTLKLLALITLISLAPGIAVTVTCFPFIVTVLSILRQAIGLQQSPPNMLIVSLSLFLTYYVMEDVFYQSYSVGFVPLGQGDISVEDALPLLYNPFREFMMARIDRETLEAFSSLLNPNSDNADLHPSFSVLAPSFIVSEMSKAFQVGFLLFLPFLVIDLVVAAILMSMGMMMVPPAIVSLPFKLAFFVLADGWRLIAGSLIRSYA